MTPEKLTKPHESKPWNPIIANVFYRAGIIEKWGTGTLDIIDKCKENGNPKPLWKVQSESIMTILFPTSFFNTGQKPEEQTKETKNARPESRPKSLENVVLSLLETGPLSKSELSQAVGYKHISNALKKTLISLLQRGKIAYTIPTKPNSRLQKYKLSTKLK